MGRLHPRKLKRYQQHHIIRLSQHPQPKQWKLITPSTSPSAYSNAIDLWIGKSNYVETLHLAASQITASTNITHS